jgi:hypothetical protein
MRVIAQNLPPESTTVEKASLSIIIFALLSSHILLFCTFLSTNCHHVWNSFPQVMTQSPECATVDTPILDALHTMHDGKFLHLPVLDRGMSVNQCWKSPAIASL